MTSRHSLLASLAMLALAACAEADPMDRGGSAYDGIAPDAFIKLIGTEPFWTLEIQPEGGTGHSAQYSTPENPAGQAFAITRFAGNNGLGFSGELDGQSVQAAITPGECSDGMSDRIYAFSATVSVGGETLFGCAAIDDWAEE